jgi:hypothetical protein
MPPIPVLGFCNRRRHWGTGSLKGGADYQQGSAQVFSECRLFSAGMKIVVDKNLENTVWQCF